MSAQSYIAIRGLLVSISSFPGSHTDGPDRTVNSDTWNSSKANGARFTPREPTLLAETFKFSARNGKFEPHGDNAVLTFSGSDIQIVARSVIIDDWSGLKVPCIVIEQQKQAVDPSDSSHIFIPASGESSKLHQMSIVLLSTTKRKFVVRGSFRLAYSFQSATKFFIQDGPRICWERQGCVYVTRPFSRPNRAKVDVVKLDESLWKASNTLKWFGLTVNGDAVAVGTEHGSGDVLPSNWDHKWVMVRLPVAEAGESTAPIAAEGAFMPHEYSNIVKCVHSQQADFGQSGGWQGGDLGAVVLAATNTSQLVESRGGVVRRLCNLPFKNACEIAVATVTGEEDLIVVRSSSSIACAVWKRSFKIAAEWSCSHALLVDDFIQSGTDQVLLLGNCRDAHQNSFYLTDLGTCNWTSSGNDNLGITKTPSACADNLVSAVQALEAQIQTGTAALRASQSQCRLKERLIKQSQEALHNMVERLPSPASPSTSLMCFCNQSGEDHNMMDAGGEENTGLALSPTLKCLRCWQRVAMEHWIIGVEVENQTDRQISDVHLSVIPTSAAQTSICPSTSTSTYRSLLGPAASHPRSPSQGRAADDRDSIRSEPACKRPKLDRGHRGKTAVLEPGETMTTTGVAAVPEFARRPVAECSVMLHWKEWLPRGGRAGPGETQRGGDMVARQSTCSSVMLTASDVVTGKLAINPTDSSKSESESRIDVQALDAIQRATPLLLTSEHSSLKCVEGLLKDHMGFRSSAPHRGLLSHSAALGMTRVHILSRDGPRRMTVNVYSRNQSDLLLFCQHLYQLLPDDVIIKPCPPTNQIGAAVATAMTAIDRELQGTLSFLRQSLGGLSSSTAQGHHGQDAVADGAQAGPSKKDEMAEARGDFEGERRAWRDSDANVDVCPPDGAHALRQHLLNLKINADANAVALASLLTAAN